VFIWSKVWATVLPCYLLLMDVVSISFSVVQFREEVIQSLLKQVDRRRLHNERRKLVSVVENFLKVKVMMMTTIWTGVSKMRWQGLIIDRWRSSLGSSFQKLLGSSFHFSFVLLLLGALTSFNTSAWFEVGICEQHPSPSMLRNELLLEFLISCPVRVYSWLPTMFCNCVVVMDSRRVKEFITL